MTATIRKHPDRPGVWCVMVPCNNDCARFGGKVPGHVYGSNWDWVPCQTCMGTTERILSTHATRDGAATSANQINRAEQ